jgi:tetratricopeptide (TPR) repeat protein
MFFAEIYERGGNYDYAINEYTRGIKEYPDNQQLYYARGKTYYNTRQYQKAVDDFSTAISLVSEMMMDCYRRRGAAYFNLKYYDEALADFVYYLNIKPDDPLANYFAARIFYERLDLSKALSHFNKTIEKVPNYFEAYAFRGDTYFGLGEYHAALGDFNIAISINGKKSELYNSRGSVYHELENYEYALNDYSHAILLDGGNSLYYYNRALLYFEMGDNYNAFSDINKAIELNPNDREYYVHRVDILLKLVESERNDSVKLHYLEMGKEDIENLKRKDKDNEDK